MKAAAQRLGRVAVRRATRRLSGPWDAWRSSLSHTAWTALQRTRVPESCWPPALHAEQDLRLPLPKRVIPLPPARVLASWLWGHMPVTLDASDRSDGRTAVLLTARPGPGSERFAEGDLPRLLLGPAGQPVRYRAGLLVIVEPDRSAEVRRAVRRSRSAQNVIVVEEPARHRRAVLLSTVSLLAVPEDAACLRASGASGASDASGGSEPWSDVARAAGVVLWPTDQLSAPPAGPSAAPGLRDASRRGRHSVLSATTPRLGADEPRAALSRVVEKRRVVVSGHDLKFATGLMDRLRDDGHEVRVDAWAGHERHDVEQSRACAAWADVVFCEWTLGNAVWYSRHRPPGQRLVTRLHLQEARTDFPRRVQADRMVFVAEHIRRQVVRDSGVPEQVAVWIPNAVDVPSASALGIPVSGGGQDRRFRIGMVGTAPARKGLHAALDTLSSLRASDRRYTLSIKGAHPTTIPWIQSRPSEMRYIEDQMRRIRNEPLLQGAVRFEGFDPDIGAWYRDMGVVLSTSDFESFHFTLPDGAAQGCVPRSLSWPGADLFYPQDWLAPDVSSLAQSIQEITEDPEAWASAGDAARRYVTETFAAPLILPRLTAEIVGG